MVTAQIETDFCRAAEVAVLPAHQFAAAVTALPLVSVDWVLINPDGQLLLGQCINASAYGWWFTPSGRIRKNEACAQALLRVGSEELGLRPDVCLKLLAKARLMGAWDHFYPDSVFSTNVSTHYVNLPHWLPLSWDEVASSNRPRVRNTAPGNGFRWPMPPSTR